MYFLSSRSFVYLFVLLVVFVFVFVLVLVFVPIPHARAFARAAEHVELQLREVEHGNSLRRAAVDHLEHWCAAPAGASGAEGRDILDLDDFGSLRSV